MTTTRKPFPYSRTFVSSFLLFPLLLSLWSTELRALASLPQPQAVQDSSEALEVGKTIERALAGGQTHRYQLQLAADQYLKLVVQQRGVDVKLRLFTTDNQRIVEWDQEPVPDAQESLEWVATSAGEYLLEIVTVIATAKAGGYELRWAEQRAALGQEREMSHARQRLQQASDLEGAGKYDEAISVAQEPLAKLEKLAGATSRDVARVLHLLGILYYRKRDYSAAEPLYQRALTIREKALGQEHPDVAASLHNLAILYYQKGDYAAAEPLLQRALTIREKTLGPEHPHVAISLYGLAELYSDKGDYAAAAPLYQRALTIREKTLGPEHPHVAVSLHGLAELYSAKGDYAAAAPLYQRALKMWEKTLGQEHPNVAASLDSLANLYRAKGEYAAAAPLYQRALTILEKALGQEHPNVAASLNNLASLYYHKGDYAAAAPLYQRALRIREKAMGQEHPVVADSLSNLAVLYVAKGDYTAAEPLYQRALRIREKALGQAHPAVTASLHNLAILYSDKGDYATAEPLYQRALMIKEKALGQEHPDVASLLNSLANLYRNKGDYTAAAPLYQRALTIWEKALGQEHPNVAASLTNLAILYYQKGDYAAAELLYQRALTIREKVLGQEHPDVANSLNGLAELYRDKGNAAAAEPLYQRALTIQEKALGQEHPTVAASLNNLALLYHAKGDYSAAEPLYQRALTIQEKALGQEHPTVAASLNNLANLYRAKGDYAAAVPIYQRALMIREKMLGQEHPDVANSLYNLAKLYHAKGDDAAAEPLHQRALRIRKKALGPEHPNVATSLHGLASLHRNERDFARAVPLFERMLTIYESNLWHNLVGSDQQRQAYLRSFTASVNSALALHPQLAPQESSARQLALTALLRFKGRSLDESLDTLNRLRSRADKETQPLLERLATSQAQYARLTLRGPGTSGPAAYRVQLDNLAREIGQLEADLSRRSQEFRASRLPITPEAVTAAIPDKAALIEFVQYHPLEARTNQQLAPHYAVYVLTQQGEPRWAELGTAAPIDQQVEALRQALRDPRRRDFAKLARAVDQQVMAPVRKLLGGKTNLLIAPDGKLNLLPFAALVDEQGKYLVERFHLTYLSSGRDLLRLQIKQPAATEALVLANPDFGVRAAATMAAANPTRDIEIVKATTNKLSESVSMAQISFGPLRATAGEAAVLKSLLPSAQVLTGNAATEGALKQVHRPKLLHIATHGYFLPDLVFAPAPDRASLTENNAPLKTVTGEKVENPLLRAGLAFAGANQRQSGEDDGILTALEAAGLDLWGTKLVVLSACDTGVGEIKNGEGVYGLRRAFALAGSEAQVMSLWPVSDVGTKELMVKYYQRLLKGEGRGAALRQVQLALLKNPQRKHPFYWASFIHSGEWANLDGKR